MRVIEDARAQNLQVTLGYMSANTMDSRRMANWVRSGFWVTSSRCEPTCRHGYRSGRKAVSLRIGRGCRTTAAAFSTISEDTCSTRSSG